MAHANASKAVTRLYVSVTRKQSCLGERELPFYGLEVYLNRVEEALADELSLYAVARIVPDYTSYLQAELKIGEAAVSFERVQCPLKHRDRRFSLGDFEKEGYPKASDVYLLYYESCGVEWLVGARRGSR